MDARLHGHDGPEDAIETQHPTLRQTYGRYWDSSEHSLEPKRVVAGSSGPLPLQVDGGALPGLRPENQLPMPARS
jgi:hypothetical protein